MPTPHGPKGVSRHALDEHKPPLGFEIRRDADEQILGETLRVGEHGFKVRRQGTDEWFAAPANAPHTSAMYWLDRDPRFTVKDDSIVGSLQESVPFPHSPDEVPNNGDDYPEGARKQVMVNKYERDPKARKECLKYWGYCCAACGFSFEERYGSRGREYIHVHHKVPLSTVGPDYKINPKKDLIPICPNCHAMIHRGPGQALTIEELKQQLRPTQK